ncbi:MAG TPA: sulfur carrier protein ThiS [Phycisphaerae bacterium]|nr:sulfur carrier protein ThiS [Phycisphaerae bacterium]
MTIQVNGQEQEVEPDATLGRLVAAFRFNPRHVAVEVNEELVPRRLYDATALRGGDRVEIVTLVGGG